MRIHFIVTPALALTTMLVGCASDPNKNVNSAANEQAQTDADYQAKQANLTADQRSEQSELQKKQREERASLSGEHERAAATSQSDTEKARTDLIADRKAFASEANEKLSKLTARADELKKKSSKLKNKAKSSYQTDMAHYTAKRTEVTTELNALDSTSDAAWDQAKTSAKARLDELEHAVDGMGKHF